MLAYIQALRMSPLPTSNHAHLSSIFFLFGSSSFVIAALRLLDSCHSFAFCNVLKYAVSLALPPTAARMKASPMKDADNELQDIRITHITLARLVACFEF